MIFGGGAGQYLQIFLVWLLLQQSHCQITFTMPPSDLVIARGSPALFNCTFTSTGSFSITWQRGGRILSPSISKYSYLFNNSLLIDPTETGDEGMYSCVVTDQNTMQAFTQNASLTFAFITNSFVTNPESQTVEEGSLALFFCIHSGSVPPVDIEWRRNNVTIITSSRVIVRSSVLQHTNPPQVSSSLAITSVQRSDVGQITCVARNPLLQGSPVTSAPAILSITVQPFAPSITVHPDDLVVQEGRTANLSCSVDGEPVPVITWSFNSSLISPSPQITISTTNGGRMSVLALARVERVNTGTYQCTATNSQGTVSSSTALLQLASLGTTFMLQPADNTTVIGEIALLDCSSPPSIPSAVISWSRNFAQLNSPRYQVLQNGSLMISDVELGDHASYTCTATNPLLGASRTSRGATLTVIGEPSITTSANITLGQSASFSCSPVGSTSPQITWFQGSAEITADFPRVTLSDSGSTLTISNVTVQDGGYYTCRTLFPSRSTQARALLTILAPPSFQNASLNLTAIQSLPVIIPCSIFPDASATFTWSFEGVPLSPSTSGGALVLFQNGSLVVSNVQSANEGSYICVASNNLGRTSGVVYLEVLVAPGINAAPASLTAVMGNTATLRCTATGDPIPVQSWSRNGITLTSGSRFQISADGQVLTITDVREEEDEGVYICHASNSAGTDSATVTLNVIFAPSASTTPSSLRLNAGSVANFTCTTTGDPSPQIRWLRQNSDVSTLGDQRIQVQPAIGGGLSLVIRDLQGNDQQQYVCEATNVVSMDTSTVSLTVLVAPSVNISGQLNVVQGNPLTIDCNVIGQPAPVVTWFRSGTAVQENSRTTVDSQGRLQFTTTFSTDADTYTCVATSQLRTVSANTTLQVYVVPVIRVSMPMLIANEGMSAVLDCLATGNPEPTVMWFLNSVLYPNPGAPRFQQASNNSLLISTVQSSDGGTYICQATNIAGTESSTIQLVIHVAPIIVPVATMVTGIAGMTTTLSCTVTGVPAPIQTWTRNGIAPSDSRFQILNNGSDLIISEIREEDQGEYRCHASNSAGSDTAVVRFNVISIPVVQVPIATVIVVQRSSAVLDCLAMGDPEPVVRWFFNSMPVSISTSSRFQQSSNNSLTLSNVQTTDRGTYTCTATNAAGTTSATIQLIVYVVPVITVVENPVIAVIGRTASLSCLATGDPAPVQTWTRNGGAVSGSRVQISADGSNLTISDAREEDEGVYQCHASNPARTQSEIVTLSVIIPPSFTLLNNGTATENTQFSLNCMASGDPTPSITWSSNGNVLPSTQGVLPFSPVLQENAGPYTCTATNVAGTISSQVFLNVEYRPSIVRPPATSSVALGSRIELTCGVDGNPLPQITWLLNTRPIPNAQQASYVITVASAADAGVYTCMASNRIGTASHSATLTVLFPPSPPTLLVATSISSTVISLRWSASTNDGGAPLTAYVVEFRAAGSTSSMFQSRSFGATVLSGDLGSLTPFITYDVRVLGENAVGRGDPSNTQTTRTHPDAPTAPRNFGVASSIPSLLSLRWEVPQPINGMLAAYELRYAEEVLFDSNLQERLLFLTQFTIPNVRGGVVYRIEVRASTVSLTGETLWGPFAILRVRDGMELEVPTLAPTTPSPSTEPPSTATPTTEPPSTAPPSTASTATPSTATPSTATPSTATPSTATPSTATPSTSPLSTSEPITTSVPLNPPTSVPAVVTAFIPPQTTGQILIYWREPSPPSDDFIGYHITISPTPPPAITMPILVSRTPISGSHVLMGLAHFTNYTITVATYNNDGVGPQTEMSSAMTPEATPSAPRAVEVNDLGSGSIIISWLPPDQPNGILTGYLLRVLNDVTGQEVDRRDISLAQNQQNQIQIVNIAGLDLENIRYRILISARTQTGTGPDSEPTFIGTETPTTMSSSSSPPSETTSPSDVTRGTTDMLRNTTDVTRVTTDTTRDATDMTSGTTDISLNVTSGPTDVTRDAVYYVVRIVPPVVAVLLLIVTVIVVVLCCCFYGRGGAKRRKGVYKFEGFDNDYRLELKQQLPPVEQVEPDGSDESNYIKGALNSNFTFSPPSQESSEEDSVDLGEELGNQVILMPSGGHDAVGRDAVQEQEEEEEETQDAFMSGYTSSGRVQDNRSIGSHSEASSVTSGQKPVYKPGDYSYAELNAIRAKKAEERARRFGKQGQAYATPTNAGIGNFNPIMGMSSGGILETRIGQVGMARNGGLPTVPEANAHMY